MSEPSNPSEWISLLNQQAATLQMLLDYQYQADALLETALSNNFLQNPHRVIHDFLWNLGNMVKQSKILNEALLDDILKIISALNKPLDIKPQS